MGELVTFVADEQLTECTGGSDAPPSTQAPRDYSWSVSPARVLQLVRPGVVRMLDTGSAIVRVTRGGRDETLSLRVVPRVARVAIAPAAATLAVGDTVSFVVTAHDASGALVAAIGRRAGTVRLEVGDPAIVANQVTPEPEPERYLLRAYAAGSTTVTARLPVFGAQQLRAVATVMVR
ncbi:MAG TPA: hypothetical protein VGD77_17390 [Gemmatimonadaceae bacterium]